MPSSMITAIRGRQRECALLDGSQVQQNINKDFGTNENSNEIHSAKKQAQTITLTIVLYHYPKPSHVWREPFTGTLFFAHIMKLPCQMQRETMPSPHTDCSETSLIKFGALLAIMPVEWRTRKGSQSQKFCISGPHHNTIHG